MQKRWFLLFLILPLLFFCLLSFKPRPYLTVAGKIKMADGLGRQTVELLEAFYGDFTLNALPTGKRILTDVPPKIKNLIGYKFKKSQIGTVLFYEETLFVKDATLDRCLRKLGAKRSDQIRIAYSMCESSLIPAIVVDRINHTFDAVAVPDPFLIEVYRNSGVTLPLFVLPLGLNLSPFLEQPLKEKAHTPFCFINLSSCEPRKNLEALILAFHKAFGNDPRVELRINCRVVYEDALEKTVALINSLQCTNVILTDKRLDNEQYRDFMTQGDVFVTLSKGEGFSIQPREAMALGMPVILSNNTAHKTILDSHLAIGISCPQEEMYVNKSFHALSGKRFLADIDESAKAMRVLYENYEESLQKAAARREWTRQYQFSQLKALYRNLIKPEKILLGEKDEVSEEYLMTSSPALYEKYKRLTQ